MIVRISTEGQYRVPSADLDRLNTLDNNLVDAVARGDEEGYRQLLGELLQIVRNRGEAVPLEELVASDVILPAPDLSLEEARELFVGEGAFPG